MKKGIVTNQSNRITLRGPIMGSNPGYLEEGEYISPKMFKDALDSVTGNEIEVVINSQGGDVFASIEIYNLLKESDKKVKTIISGRAFSGGHIIAMAGDERLIYDNSQGLAHRASTVAWGNALQLLETVEWLEKVDNNIANIYSSVYTGTKEELQNLLDKDVALNAQQCLDLGFATQVIKHEETVTDKEDKVVKDEIDIEALAKKVAEIMNSTKETKEVENKKENKNLFQHFKGAK